MQELLLSLGVAVCQNEAGQSLIEFCQEDSLGIANTLFQQRKKRLYTWTSPDGQHQNLIDYIICSQRWRSSIQSAKTRKTARRSNQSILKEISPECSLEGLMLKQKLQYFGRLMQRADSFEKTLILGKIEGRRRSG